MSTLAEVTRISIKNILIPTDFSEPAAAALPFAKALAQLYDSELLVTHVLPPEPHREIVLDPAPELDDQGWYEAKNRLSHLAQERAVGNLRMKTLLARGDLEDVIPRLVHDHAIDLVVLGTHGRRGVSKLVLGSAAEKIYRCASCPVLTVGPRAQESAGAWSLRRILCPVDVTEDPEPVLRYALALAEENEASVLILQAIPLVPWQHREWLQEQSLHALEALIPAHAKDWCRPEVMIRWEHPAEAILETAIDREAQLIVMSVHKARVAKLSSHLPWPVASEVVSRARCPVLTLRV